MFIRPHKRFKNGKWHTYYSVVENRRCTNGQHVQRQVLYLGEISSSQEDAWQQALDKFNPTCQRDETLDLFASPRTLSTAKVRTLSLSSANFSGVVRKPIPWGAGILPALRHVGRDARPPSFKRVGRHLAIRRIYWQTHRQGDCM